MDNKPYFNTIKVRKNLELTLWEKSYIPEIVRGLYVTGSHFFKNLIGFVVPPKGRKRLVPTIYYPEEKPVIPPAFRGRPSLVAGKDGKEKCVACGLCESICPAEAIRIVGGERDGGQRYPEEYNLRIDLCVFCGFCEEVCPVEAIVMSHIYEGLCTYKRDDMDLNKEQLLVPEKDLTARLDYIREIYSKKNYE